MLDTVTAPDGSKIDYNFCGCGHLRSLVDPLGNMTKFDYETTFDKLSLVTDARGNDLIYTYDTKGNLAKITYEDTTHQDYSYNAKGQLTGSVNRRGQNISYEYNLQYQRSPYQSNRSSRSKS
jgi:YD repeat-containing protein